MTVSDYSRKTVMQSWFVQTEIGTGFVHVLCILCLVAIFFKMPSVFQAISNLADWPDLEEWFCKFFRRHRIHLSECKYYEEFNCVVAR